MELIGVAILAWAIGLWVLLIWAAGSIAESKNRRFDNWGLLAFAYGLIAVITVYLMPPLKPER